MAKKKSSSKKGTVELLVIIGAIITIILAIYYMIPAPSIAAWSFGLGIVWAIVFGIINIILALGLLAGAGLLNFKFKISMQWLVLLIIGILILVPTSNWGGLFVIIAAILKLVL